MIVMEYLRKQRGWSRAELARRARMQGGVVAWIEEGRFLPYPSQLSKLAEALGVGEPPRLLEQAQGNDWANATGTARDHAGATVD